MRLLRRVCLGGVVAAWSYIVALTLGYSLARLFSTTSEVHKVLTILYRERADDRAVTMTVMMILTLLSIEVVWESCPSLRRTFRKRAVMLFGMIPLLWTLVVYGFWFVMARLVTFGIGI